MRVNARHGAGTTTKPAEEEARLLEEEERAEEEAARQAEEEEAMPVAWNPETGVFRVPEGGAAVAMPDTRPSKSTHLAAEAPRSRR